MAHVIGTYGDGAGKKKKKTAGTVTPAATPAAPAAPKVVTPTKPEKPASVNVPAQSYDEARREQRRDQRYRNGQAPVPAAPPVEKQQPDDPLDTGWLLSAKKQAEAAWEKWLWETDTPHRFTLEDFYRQIGIPVTDDPEYAGMIPSLSQLVRDAHRAANTRPSEEEETLYPGMTDEKFLRLWYQDDPAWDNGVRDGDAARAEQRAGKKYQETKESRQIAEDASVRSALEEKFAEKRWEAEENDRIADGMSTQAAIDEKLAMRKALASAPDSGYTESEQEARKFWEWLLNNDSFYSPHSDLLESIQARKETQHRAEMAEGAGTQSALDEKLAERRYWNELAAKGYAKDNEAGVQSGVLYNEHTGEIFVPANKKNNETGRWETYSLDGKILVDPEVERRFGVLSNGISAVLTGTGAVVTKKPTVMMLQPIMATLVKAGLLEKKYEGKEYILNNPHTNEIGISVSGALGARLSGSIGIAADCYGNVGIVLSGGGGGGTPNLSGSLYMTTTNAPEIGYLGGKSAQAGGSAGPIGVDVVGFCNPNSGEAYYGISTSVGTSIIPVDLHASMEYSVVLNMKELFEQLNGK